MDRKTKSNNTTATNDRAVHNCEDLKVAQINLLHCKRATYSYCRDLKMKHTNISIIQEPWIRANKVHGFGQLHDQLFYHRKGKKPRAAIHVSKDMDAMILNQFCDDDLVVVRINRDKEMGGDFIVVSSYMPMTLRQHHQGHHSRKLLIFVKTFVRVDGRSGL